MVQALMNHEALIRVIGFASVLGLMLLWERLARYRPDPLPWRRITANLGLAAVDALLLRLLLPAAAVGAALWAEARGFGLIAALDLPATIAFALTIVILDLALWAQHVLTHKVPLLWRLHRVHHSDIHFDTTTGVRFHPVEILLSMAYKMGVVVLLGAPAAAVIAFEILLNGAALFNHGNVRLPALVERMARLIVVTPDFHRVHHSARAAETDSNYGFFLSVWDRLFRTYRPRPVDDPAVMMIGLPQWRETEAQSLPRLLLQPIEPLSEATRSPCAP
jgi:sterol desaturase/sphingolipid hydroxylase (fatty acid hydroxylase superfamily)